MEYYVGDTVTWRMDQISPDSDTFTDIWTGIIISETLRPDRTTVFELRVLETEHAGVSGFRYECHPKNLISRSVAHEPRKVPAIDRPRGSLTDAFIQKIRANMLKADHPASADPDVPNLHVGEQVTWQDLRDNETGFEIGDEHNPSYRIGTIIAERLMHDGSTEYEVEVELVAGRFDPRIKVVCTAGKLARVSTDAATDSPFLAPLALQSAYARLPRPTGGDEPAWQGCAGGRYVAHVEDQPNLYSARFETYDEALLYAYKHTRERLLRNGCGAGLVYDTEGRRILKVLGFAPDSGGRVDAGIMRLPALEEQQRMVEIVELVDRREGRIDDFIWQTWTP